MAITISNEARTEVISSMQRYFAENMDEPLGNLAADSLLIFILAEIGPLIYNKAVNDVQDNLQSRISELDIEVHEAEFQYWRARKPK
jgi:uncharacterized protein (DUF2164 family)